MSTLVALALASGVALAETWVGTNGPDNRQGTADNDDYAGAGGNDLLVGMGGADRLNGGDDNDELYGGRRDTGLLTGTNTVLGGYGKDRIWGDDGADELRGGPHDDTIHDSLKGDQRVDTIDGNEGQDAINAVSDPAARDGISCGSGPDTAYADYLDAVANDCETVYVYGGSGDDTIEGTPSDDTINGLGGNDSVSGLGGNDTLGGDAGADVLHGGEGNDTIFDAAESDAYVDTIYGDAGDDVITTVSAPASKDVIANCGEGVDEVFVDSLDVVAGECENVTDAVADVNFATEVSVAQALRLAEEKDARILTLEDDYVIGGEQLADFYVSPPTSDTATAEQALERQRLGFYEDMINEHRSEEITAEEKAEEQPMIDGMQAALASGDAGSINITGMILIGEKRELLASSSGDFSAASTGNETVDTMGLGAAREQVIQEEDAATTEYSADATDESTLEATASSTWFPNFGRSKVAPSAVAGDRYVSQRFTWKSNNLGFYDGYEHDFVTENYSGYHYLTGRQTRFCFPVTSHAPTSLPANDYRYLDTNYAGPRQGCERDVLTYTIGVAQADDISSDRRYFTYIRTPKGNADQDRAVLYSQLSQRRPDDCYSVWCAYGVAYRTLIEEPGDDWYRVPGYRAWTE